MSWNCPLHVLLPAFSATVPRSPTPSWRTAAAAADFAVLHLVGAVYMPQEGTLGGKVAMGPPSTKLGAGVPHTPARMPATHAVLTRPVGTQIAAFGRYPATTGPSPFTTAKSFRSQLQWPMGMDHDHPLCRGQS